MGQVGGCFVSILVLAIVVAGAMLGFTNYSPFWGTPEALFRIDKRDDQTAVLSWYVDDAEKYTCSISPDVGEVPCTNGPCDDDLAHTVTQCHSSAAVAAQPVRTFTLTVTRRRKSWEFKTRLGADAAPAATTYSPPSFVTPFAVVHE
jgi:hypothetical protein